MGLPRGGLDADPMAGREEEGIGARLGACDRAGEVLPGPVQQWDAAACRIPQGTGIVLPISESLGDADTRNVPPDAKVAG